MREAAGYSRERVVSWQEIHERLAAPDRIGSLAPEELDLLAEAAYLIGHDGESARPGPAHMRSMRPAETVAKPLGRRFGWHSHS